MNNDSEEENPDWNRCGSYIPSPDDPHEFGEYREDWHDYKWRKEQEEMILGRRLAESRQHRKFICYGFYYMSFCCKILQTTIGDGVTKSIAKVVIDKSTGYCCLSFRSFISMKQLLQSISIFS